MIIQRTSILSGIAREMDLDITQEQIDQYNSGQHVQNAFPNLNEDEREFFISGITKEEWDDFFKDNNDI